MNKDEIRILLMSIKEQRSFIRFRLGKFPNEIKMNNNTLDNISANCFEIGNSYIELKAHEITIFGMKILIDETLEDKNFELTLSNIFDLF